MKKILSAVLVCVMLLGCVFALASCGNKLSGTYESTLMGKTVSYEFDGDVVKTTIPSLIGGTTTFTGEYTIEEDKIVITYEDDGVNTALAVFGLAGEMSFNKGNDNDGNFIELNGFKFVKK